MCLTHDCLGTGMIELERLYDVTTTEYREVEPRYYLTHDA